MKVLILVPTAFPSLSGNAVTVERWRRSLIQRGIGVEVLAHHQLSARVLVERIRRYVPDVIHVHHAYRAGALLLDPLVAGGCSDVPVVVSPGGTDIHIDLEIPQRRNVVLQVLGIAGSIVSQSPETDQRLRNCFPDLCDRIVHVPKACSWFGDEAYDLRKTAGVGREHFVLFMPAGVRPVKGNLECLLALEKVSAIRPDIRFVAAGKGIDLEYTDRFKREMERLNSFASWIDGIPPACMRSAYEASDVVLNFSSSEGLSNALLEAIASERPILAANISGNRYPVLGNDGDPPAGILFNLDDPDDFVRSAIRLVDDANLRMGFVQSIRARKSRWPKPEDEAAGLLAAYEAAIFRRSRR